MGRVEECRRASDAIDRKRCEGEHQCEEDTDRKSVARAVIARGNLDCGKQPWEADTQVNKKFYFLSIFGENGFPKQRARCPQND